MLYSIKWISFLGSLLVLNSGCTLMSTVGQPPKVDLCELRITENPNQTFMVRGRCKNQKSVKFDLDVSKLDGYMCVHPDQFVDAFTYIDKLITAVKKEIQNKK